MNVIHKLPCEILSFSKVYEDDDDMMKVRVKVCHDGENPNGSDFSLNSIANAKPSLSNRPILAHSVFDEDKFEVVDFGGHDMEQKIIENEDGGYEVKTKYLETPLGVINEDHDYSLETDEDTGRTYPIISGYVWKSYSNGAWKLIEEGKGVSMEISVKSGVFNKSKGLFEINDFSYRGITILSDDVKPAMDGANIIKYASNELSDSLEVFNKKIKEGKENNLMDKEITVENEEEIVVEEVIEVEKTEIDPIVEETFALSTEDMGISIQNKLKDRKVEVENYWGEKYSTREFYLYTMIPDEKIVVLEDNNNYGNYYGVPYEIKGDDVELNFDAKVPYIQEWRAKKENEVVEVFAKEDELKDIVLEKFAKKQIELDAMKVELESLKQFKEVKDKEDLAIKVEEVINEFNLQEEEVETFKANALEGKLGLDELKKELFCLVGMKALSNKEKFSTKEEVVNEIKVMDVEKFSNEKVAYGGLFEKHGIK